MTMNPQPLPCPLTTALESIGGKWHLIVLYALAEQPRRFNELQLTDLRLEPRRPQQACPFGRAAVRRCSS
jgi:hypothetical protein